MSPTSFTDRKGRVWDVALDLLKVRRVTDSDFTAVTGEGSGKVNLLRPAKDTFTRVLMDAQLLAAVCWSIVSKDQLPAIGFKAVADATPEELELEFVSGFNGATIAAARDALTEALVDFFPDLRIALFALKKQLRTMDDKVTKKMQEMEPMLDDLMEKAMEEGIQNLKAELLSKKLTSTGETSTPSQPTPASASPISGAQASHSGISS